MNVRRLASYRLLLSNIESSLQWNKRRQSHLKLIIASWPVVCQLVLKRIERETFDRSMVGHFIAAFSVLSNAETMLFKTDGSNNFHLHHHLVDFFNFDTAWCVACGRPSITALTWCRGISWSVLREKSGKKQACSHIFFVEKLFSAFVIISVSTESCALIGAGCVKPAVFARLKPECVD
ncbi:Phosphoenolpyruvate carboxylase [Trichinella spiralis]|uniref:Phosphoenolpyruvate carboxylase n=1 Tax=Trichinella spiralis TaxID=6334 RepID=A0ABR3KJP5_TRISP